MRMKRIVSLLLSLVLLLTLLSGCETPTRENSDTPADPAVARNAEIRIEIDTAIAHGLVPEELQENFGATIRYDQFCAMMTTVIRKLYGEGQYMEAWKKNAGAAFDNTSTMTRGAGAEVIFVAALSVEMEDYHSSAYQQLDLYSVIGDQAFEGLPYRDDLFPILKEPYTNKNWNERDPHWSGFQAAADYVWHRTSSISHKTIMEYEDETFDLRFTEKFTRGEAIAAALRCYEGWVGRDYVPTDDPRATAYDASIITAELLNRESSLPEVTHDNLPSDWVGLTSYRQLSTMRAMIDSYRQQDVRFVKENGMNLLRIAVGCNIFRYPDFPEDANLVNVAELERLDQMVAWAMEYDVHLCIGLSTLPGYGPENDNTQKTGVDSNWPTPQQWDILRNYWVMLAKRYAGIPAKNLTFELCAEWWVTQPDHLADFGQQFKRIADEMWAASPDRVLLASFTGSDPATLAMAEEMAKIGVSVAAHPFYPGLYNHFSRDFLREMGYTQEFQWPIVWFPSEDFNDRNVPIRLSGAIGGTTLSVCVADDELFPTETGEPALIVTADGKEVGRHTFTTGGGNDLCTVTIPAGTQEVLLTHTGHVWLRYLTVEGPFGTSQIATPDAIIFNTQGQADLVLGEDGSWSDIEGRMFDKEAYYEAALAPYVELTEKYNVGFMVNEFFFFMWIEDVFEPFPLDEYLEYYGDCIDVFEEHNIGYVTTAVGHRSNGLNGDAREQYSMWSEYPDYIGWETYIYANGLSETFPVNNTLLNLIKEHIK